MHCPGKKQLFPRGTWGLEAGFTHIHLNWNGVILPTDPGWLSQVLITPLTIAFSPSTHFMVSVNNIPHMPILKLVWMKLLCPLLQSSKLTFSMATHPFTYLPSPHLSYKLYSRIFWIHRQSVLIRTFDGKAAEANSYSRLSLAWLCKSSVLSQHLHWKPEICTCGREHHNFSVMPWDEVFPFTRVTWQFPHFGFFPCALQMLIDPPLSIVLLGTPWMLHKFAEWICPKWT